MRTALSASLAALAGCTPMGGGYGHGMGGYGFMGYGIIFWVIALVVVVVAIMGVFNSMRGEAKVRGESPLAVLKRRYANGEIDEEEFERRKKFLEESNDNH